MCKLRILSRGYKLCGNLPCLPASEILFLHSGKQLLIHSKLNLLPMEKKRTDLAFVRFLFAEFLMYLKKQGICLCSDYGGGLKSFEKPEFPVGCPGESERKRQIPCFFRFSLGLSCILQKYFDCCHQARRIGAIFCYYVVGCAVGR